MLEIHALSVAYRSHLVLQNLSLTVRSGEILAVIGPNGAGKTTLIRAISGVLPVQTGEICIAGQDMIRLPPSQRARYLAVVPQARDLPAAYTVYQTVLLGRTPHLGWLGQTRSHDHTQVQVALEQVQALALSDRRVGELSGGEQQRVLLARALAQDTPALLLDEPTTHLDLQHQLGLLNLVRKLAAEKNLAVLVVLHDLNLVGLYADRVLLLVGGRLQAVGTPGDVLTQDMLSSVYNVPIHVVPHPDYGTPLILPDGRHTLSTRTGRSEEAESKKWSLSRRQ